MPKKFRGIGCPCVTPFTEENELDLTGLRELIDFLINNEINAIIAAGCIGESQSLTDDEYLQVIDTAIDQVNKAVPVYIGLPIDNNHRILTIANYATSSGAEGLVLYPPRIPSLTQLELVNHFENISSNINNNLLIVNDPDTSRIDLPVDSIEKISKFDNVVGLIEVSNDFKKISQISTKVSSDFHVYTGRGLLVPQAIKEGGVEGAIIPSANVVPNLLVELYEAFNVEMMDRFEELQTNLIPLEIGLKLRSFPVTVKSCLNLLGLNIGVPRKPYLPIDEGNLEKLRNILIGIGCLRPSSIDEEEDEKEPNKAAKKTIKKEK
ncbi:MAG: dihydrodipicolinate synthase family protein [Asgard group archaeon]|nr:dihydrodipicolinate synthase family protein [Asgard group archaeon]